MPYIQDSTMQYARLCEATAEGGCKGEKEASHGVMGSRRHRSRLSADGVRQGREILAPNGEPEYVQDTASIQRQ
jgi:hypothetical protein